LAQNNISIATARGNFLTWCVSGYLPLAELCRPLYVAPMITTPAPTEPPEGAAARAGRTFGASGAFGARPGEFYIIYSVNEARELFGAGSIAVLMAMQHFDTCPELPLYVTPLLDPEGGIKAQHTITFTGPATDTGVLSVDVLDFAFVVAVNVGASAASVATSLATQFGRFIDFPFTAEAAGDVVTLTAKNAGPVGNWFTPLWNPRFGDTFPPGIDVEVKVKSVPGSGVYDLEGTIGTGPEAYNWSLALPFNCHWDCVGLGIEDEVVKQFLIQLIRRNWKCGVQGDFKGGHLFASFTNSAGQIAYYGRGRNNPEETVVPVRTGYKYPGYVLTAAFTSRCCCTACWDPSRPMQYDNGLLGNLYDSRQCAWVWSPEEKRAFFDAGIANWDIANARGIRMTNLWIEEPLTTYKYDPFTGAPDGAWQRVENRYTVVKFVRDLGFWYRRNYSSVSLVSDGTPIPPGKRAVSPRIMKASLLAWIRGTQLGWTVEDPGYLERMVQVERANTPAFCDPNRLSVMLDIDLVNQLARIATTIDSSPEFACIPPVLLPGAFT